MEFHLCINGKAKTTKYEAIDLNAIYCRDTCPMPGAECDRETIRRLFNNPQDPKQWDLMLRKKPLDKYWQKGQP